MLRRLFVLLLIVLAPIVGLASPALAHNSLVSSDPSDGATLTAPPTSVTMVFAKDVPLETLTVTLTDPTGSRTDLAGSVHGATAVEVVTPLAPLVDGAYSLRWRLVGPDGHAITGRVQFTVAAALPGVLEPTMTSPARPLDPTSAPTPASVGEPATGDWSTPGWLRWLLRYGSYLAIMIVAGVVVTEAFVWRDAINLRVVRRLTEWSFGAILLGAVGQLLVLASDLSAEPPWASLAAVGVAAEHDVGIALVIRMVIAFVGWLLIVRERPTTPQLYFDVVVLLAMGMLATWSFAGHSRSMRWPWIGVPVDVIHHGAAAAWIGGLAIVGIFALRHLDTEQLVAVMHRFARVAAWSVGVVVVTGLVQAIRLVGGVAGFLSSGHGGLLLAKLSVLAAMLLVANANRSRVQSRFRTSVVTRADVATMRQAVRRELALGLIILGVTASLVVTPPATADDQASAATISVTPN